MKSVGNLIIASVLLAALAAWELLATCYRTLVLGETCARQMGEEDPLQ